MTNKKPPNKGNNQEKKTQENNKSKIYTFTPNYNILLEELFAHHDLEETALSTLEEVKQNIQKKETLIRFILEQTKEFTEEEGIDFPMDIAGDFLLCIQYWSPEQFFRTRFVICEYMDLFIHSEVFGIVRKENGELKMEFEYYVEDEDIYTEYKDGIRKEMPVEFHKGMDDTLNELEEEDSEEAEAFRSYLDTKEDDRVMTLSEWKRMVFPYKTLFAIGEERPDLIRYVWIDDVLYLVPRDPKHTGVAIGCDRTGLHVYRLLIMNGLIQETSNPVIMYDIEDVQQAIEYTDDLFDKSTYCGMTFTVPVDPDFTVRAGEEIIYDTDALWAGMMSTTDITEVQKAKIAGMLTLINNWKQKNMRQE